MDPNRTPPNPDSDPLVHLARQLREREKELNCLFSISEIVEQAGSSVEEILEKTVELLAQAWTHADLACARIVFGGEEFQSRNYGEAASRQTQEILVSGEKVGTI